MEGKNNLLVQQEISQNMSVASQQPFAMTNEEMAFNAMMANNRSNRKRSKDEKLEQQRNTQVWINRTQSDNILEHRNSENEKVGGQTIRGSDLMRNVNREALQMVHQNNKTSSESIDTLRENFRNSQEMLKRDSCETLTIEEAFLRDRSYSAGSKERSARHSMPDINSKGETDNLCIENRRNKSTNNLITGNKANTANEPIPIKESQEGGEIEANVMKSTGDNFNGVNKTNSVDNGDKVTSANTNLSENVINNSSLENNRHGTNDNVAVDNSTTNPVTRSDIDGRRSTTESNYRRSMESMTESTYDLSRSYRSMSLKDPYTAAIDLSNNCRKFYFSHMKNAEAIKQAVRASKHARAKEKMEGKKHSTIDDAFDRLRSEMADLMDQDLSLMSQLLKLNDKIEEVKAHVAYRTRPEAYDSSQSMWEMSDSEFEESGDSRMDLSHSSRNFKVQESRSQVELDEPQKEIVLQRLVPADSRIIVYTKKSRRKKRSRKSRSGPETEEESAEESESATEEDEQTEGDSDADSTISNNSGTTIGSNHSGGTDRTSDNIDSGIQSPKVLDRPPDIPKPIVGGVSQNRKFLSFLKKNGNFSAVSGISSVLTKQGHNIPVDKFYVPQGLVYLKHTNSDNVFCQFSK